MWAALLGLVTQYFLNMEIERYTLATGETAITASAACGGTGAWCSRSWPISPTCGRHGRRARQRC
nr:hypothetical protein [Saccharopolyspora erythraea]